MSYQDDEESVHDAKPIELYKFEGTYENYYYTTAARKIPYLGHDYLPIPMERTEVNAGTENDDGLDISVDLPVTAGLILVYGFEAAPPDLNLTIYRYNNVLEVVPYWTGPVVQITTNNGIGTVQSASELGQALAEDFPNVYYQSPCNNILFDQRCKVVEANYSGTAEVVTQVGRTITVDAIPSGATAIPLDGKLVGGELSISSGESRMIITQIDTAILINFPFSKPLVAGDVLTITAGCDHAYLGDCKTKFGNQVNYGGCPFISENNPFTDGIEDGSTLPDDTCLPEVFDGVYMLAEFSAPDPCNPDWDGITQITIEDIQPNGPHGKIIGTTVFPFNSSPTITEVYEYDNPILDPRLRGQLLVRLDQTNWNTKQIAYYFTGAVFVGAYVKPSARYCGSIGKDEGTYALSVGYFNGISEVFGPKPAGGNYDIYFP